jgi:hypothetical protein
MNEGDRKSFIALPVVLLIAAGLAFAGSQGSSIVAGVPLYALCVALAFIIQWIAFVPAFLNQTERFYDLTGSITGDLGGTVGVVPVYAYPRRRG